MNYKNRAQATKQTGLSYLGSVNSSAKILKNKKYGVQTYIIYLAPAQSSGYQVCPMASEFCIDLCLNASGQNTMSPIVEGNKSRIDMARIAKTRLYFEHRLFWVNWCIAEIKAHKAAAEKKGDLFSIRINGTSDLGIDMMRDESGNNLFELFPDVQFYDYTKVYKRLELTKKYSNYHLTFSYSGTNMPECINALNAGFNVAMVFEKQLPVTFAGYTVINADDSDLRYMDEKNVICGLTFKRVRGKKDISKSPFVIKKEDKFCKW